MGCQVAHAEQARRRSDLRKADRALPGPLSGPPSSVVGAFTAPTSFHTFSHPRTVFRFGYSQAPSPASQHA